jgi:L,D-transpeptidase catalytic domain
VTTAGHFTMMLPSDPSRSRALRAALVSGAALGLIIALAGPADAAVHRTKTSQAAKTPKKEGFEGPPNGTLQIVVSIPSQRVTLFSNGTEIAQGPVSTGVPGHPTPTGVFSIIQKDRYHHSNIYGNAPMYYMQRITWSGVAMHEGALPGHAASHGCIRLSHSFAANLWPTTKLGARVIVARADLKPVDFNHASLFVPKPKPAAPLMADKEVKPSGLIQVAQSTMPSTDARALDATSSEPEAVKPAATDVDVPKPVAPGGKRFEQPIKRSGQVAVFVSRKEKKIFVRQGFVPLFDMPVEIDEPDRPLGTHVFTALEFQHDGSGMRWNLITIPTQASAAVETVRSRVNSRRRVEPVVVETKSPSTAAHALDRIRLPKEAIDRIAELLSPGSSLIVSDQGNSHETGRGTEFIVLTR